MSLYSCLDWLSAERKHLRERGLAQSPEFDLIDNLYQRLELIEQHYTMPRKAAESASLYMKRARVSVELGVLLSEFEKTLKDFKIKNPQSNYSESIRLKVLNDLETIKGMMGASKSRRHSSLFERIEKNESLSREIIVNSNINEDPYKKYQAPPYLIASISQGTMPELGNSKGECYGFTLSMLDPKIDPYRQENQGKEIVLTPDVYKRQKNLSHREKDQGDIKRSRLTRSIFCPDAALRAHELYDFAVKHPDTHLLVGISQFDAAHACYFNVQSDGKIRYMDPNFGAYLFNNKKEFIECYTDLARRTGIPFFFYQVSKLDDKQDTESLTIGGKIRSFLTGNKYDKTYENHNTLYQNTAIAGVGAVLGAVIGALVGSVIPFFGTALGAAIGGSLGVAAVVGLTQMNHQNHGGILGPFQMLQEKWYRMKHPELFNSEKPTVGSNQLAQAVDSTSSTQPRDPEGRREVGAPETNGFVQGARAAPFALNRTTSDEAFGERQQSALKADMKNLRSLESAEAESAESAESAEARRDMPNSTVT